MIASVGEGQPDTYALPCVDAQGNQIISAKDKTMELGFQTQIAKDTDEVAKYYRRLLQEARAERDEVIAALEAAKIMAGLMGEKRQ